MATLPYVTAPGNIEKALNGIKAAATPERVSQDFVKTILQIKGGSGDQMNSFLKKIGFANSDGTPTEIYAKFRNPSTSGRAAADALRKGYAALYKRNEFMHELDESELRGLIIEETGQSSDSNAVQLSMAAIKAIKSFADWSEASEAPEVANTSLNTPETTLPHLNHQIGETDNKDIGLNLSYTINLNLPATSDIAVFNAIFKSLKENLMKASNDKD